MQNTGFESRRAILKAIHMAPFKSVSDLAIQSLKFMVSASIQMSFHMDLPLTVRRTGVRIPHYH